MFTMIYYKTKAYYSVVFMLNNKIIWINIYQDDFTKAFKAFNSVISTIKYNYQTSSTSEQIKFSQIYLEFFEKTIDLFKYYFKNNFFLITKPPHGCFVTTFFPHTFFLHISPAFRPNY